MKLTFQIDYTVNRSESVYLTGSLPEMAGGIRMSPNRWGIPSATIVISPASGVFSYRYEIRRDDGSVRNEWGASRSMQLDAKLSAAEIHDKWKDIPTNAPFFASAFTDSVFRHDECQRFAPTRPSVLELRVDAPMIPADACLAITGSCESLGRWNPAAAVPLDSSGFPEWRVQLPVNTIPAYFEYKFILISSKDGSLIGWETGENRNFHLPQLESDASMIVSGMFFENPLPLWRGSGTAIPVFSLRSDKGFGVGEFADLIPLADWAASTGQQFIQLLPVNDTTMTHSWRDSYPYTTNSTFALHPMYLRLDEIGPFDDKAVEDEYNALRRELNALSAVDYERVNNAKRRFAHLLFDRQGRQDMDSDAFKSFIRDNDEWLRPYSAWCVLRDRYKSADMSSWGEYASYSAEAIDRFIEANRKETDYVKWIQYHLDRQLRHARDYASSKGIALKGDIPIGISRCSVDAWLYPELFNLDSTAGAPPDDFAIFGQNWGFPTYRWDVMARDGYHWWKSRLKKMADCFSAYRIDHLLGFFRIWQIPADTLHGLLGVFSPALPLTPDEMAERFGFSFDKDLHTRPFITDTTVEDRCGYLADDVYVKYLESDGAGRYRLADGFRNQRAIADKFSELPRNEHNRRICQALMDMLDDVLFIEDPYQKGTYHPRITAASTAIYRSLTEEQQAAFDRLYEDFYYHRHNDFWRGKALEKLPPLIESTGMLCCAEDLGMIPACVPSVMEQLKILSLEIQRMPKEGFSPFADPARYPYLSVCSTSTHDMSGIRQWWEEDYDRSQRFYTEMLHGEGAAPREAEPWICRKIVEMNLKAPSMLCILPLQDWLACDGNLRRDCPSDEQINVPADPHHYWRYRMHITLERLLEATEFGKTVSSIIRLSGR